jgi:catechol 2,3-dioxygenase-like lactoylglutathione lyase family enzyme
MRILLASALAIAALPQLHAQLFPMDQTGITMGHVHLNVKDIDAQKKFWTDQFGAKPLAIENPQLPGVKVPGMMIFFYKKDPIHPSEGTVMDHFGFKVHSLAEMEKSLKAAGFEVRPDFKGTEGFQNSYVIGPDGVKVEMQEDVTLPVKAQVNHLHYQLTDPMPLKNWYVEKMGMTATRRGAYDTANASAQNLTFTSTKTPTTTGTKGGAIDHIGFEVKDLEAYCKRLEANGLKLDVPYRKIPSLGVAIAFVTDPMGVYIELTEGLDKY